MASNSAIVKRFVPPTEVYNLAFKLAILVLDQIADFKPDFLIVLWRGGSTFGMVVQGILRSFDINTDHIAVRTESYTAPGEQSSRVAVYGLNHVVDKCNRDHKVLFVDDVLESGRSVAAVWDKMRVKMRENMPKDIRLAVGFRKTGKNKTSVVADYVAEETDQWLVFPHEVEDMTREEVKLFLGEAVYTGLYGTPGNPTPWVKLLDKPAIHVDPAHASDAHIISCEQHDCSNPTSVVLVDENGAAVDTDAGGSIVQEEAADLSELEQRSVDSALEVVEQIQQGTVGFFNGWS